MVPTVRDDPRSNLTYIFFQWENDKILMEDEYLLMDTSQILSDIGGSLGLSSDSPALRSCDKS